MDKREQVMREQVMRDKGLALCRAAGGRDGRAGGRVNAMVEGRQTSGWMDVRTSGRSVGGQVDGWTRRYRWVAGWLC